VVVVTRCSIFHPFFASAVVIKFINFSSRFSIGSRKSNLGNFAHGGYANFLHACFYLTTELKEGYHAGSHRAAVY
jgi:hypothetical protein